MTILLPAWEREMGPSPGLGETRATHGLVDFGLEECARALGRDAFRFHMRALRELLRRHIEEEEEVLFPAATPSIEALGGRLRDAFEAQRAEPWRGRTAPGGAEPARPSTTSVERSVGGNGDRARHA